MFVWAIGLNGRLHDEGDGREFFFFCRGRRASTEQQDFSKRKGNNVESLTKSARRMTQSA